MSLRGLVRVILGSTVVLSFGCHSPERDNGLARIDLSRRRLATLARDAGDSGTLSIDLAREALLEAEAALRRTSFPLSRLERLGGEAAWEPELRRGLDRVEIAEWVVEQERVRRRVEVEEWLGAAEVVVSEARQSRDQSAHFSVEARLRSAEATLREARRLKEAGELELALEKARESAALARALPPETEALVARLSDPANLRRWGALVESAIEESRRRAGTALIVDKSEQTAWLFAEGKPARRFRVELGYNGLSRKLRSGDGATPEGIYRITRRKGKGETRYHKALLLNYPNADDRVRFRKARAQGEIEPASAIGGLIEIHGEGGRGKNWTDGCVALANRDMDYLFDRLAPGSPVAIVGSYPGRALPRDKR